ncbi:hypothetical protein [Thiorhodococcus minor]
MLGILRNRRSKFPLRDANCGSVFLSDPSMYELHGPPGAVIDRLGLKGKQIGGLSRLLWGCDIFKINGLPAAFR